MDDITTKKPTVLMVDDDVLINSVVSHRLQKLNCNIETFTDPESFLLRLKKTQPTLCIVDINIKTLGVGYLLIQAIRNAYSKDLPIIILSSKAKTDDIAYGLECGANDYIIKPVTRTAFKEKVLPYLTKRDSNFEEQKLKKVPSQLRSGYVQFKGKIVSITRNEVTIYSSKLIKVGTVIYLSGEQIEEILTSNVVLRVTVMENKITQDETGFLTSASINNEKYQEEIKNWIIKNEIK